LENQHRNSWIGYFRIINEKTNQLTSRLRVSIRESLEKKKELYLIILSFFTGIAATFLASFVIQYLEVKYFGSVVLSNFAEKFYLYGLVISGILSSALLILCVWYRSSYGPLYPSIATTSINLSEIPESEINKLLSRIKEEKIKIDARKLSYTLYDFINSIDLKSYLPEVRIKLEENDLFPKLIYETVFEPKILIKVTLMPLPTYAVDKEFRELREIYTHDLQITFEVVVTQPNHRKAPQAFQWLESMMNSIILNTLSWIIICIQKYKLA